MLKTPPPVGSAMTTKDGMVSEPWRNFFQAVYKELNGKALGGFQMGAAAGPDAGDLMWLDAETPPVLHKVVDV
jgi:hypothetical protein